MVVVAVSSMAPISAHLSDDYSLYSVYNYMSVNNSMGIFPAFPVNSVPEHRDVCDTERANADQVSGLVDHDKGGGNLKESSSNSHQANAAIRHSNGSSPSGNLEKKRRIYQNYEAADDNCDLKTCDQKPSPAKAAKINHRRTATRDQQKSYRKTDEECDNKIRKVDSPEGLIFVRAKRGQATDRHSLAERGRRQKINERMRLLQRLVPGCYKVTAKAVILDEIINYVKSLQNQVDFLSMKLSAASLPYDFSLQMENHMFKDQLGVDLQQIIPAFQADVPMTDCQVALDNYDYIAGKAQTRQDMATVSTPAYDASLTSTTWSTSVNENALGCMGTNQWNADLQCLVEGEFPEQS